MYKAQEIILLANQNSSEYEPRIVAALWLNYRYQYLQGYNSYYACCAILATMRYSADSIKLNFRLKSHFDRQIGKWPPLSA